MTSLIAAAALLAAVAEPPPFPEFSAPRAITSGPKDHFFANYYAINAWSEDNRYAVVLASTMSTTSQPP